MKVIEVMQAMPNSTLKFNRMRREKKNMHNLHN